MKERIEKILNVVGWIFMVGGFLLGVISYFGIDKEPYKAAKEAYESIPDNELAQASYQAALEIYNVQFTYAMSILFGGIIIGLLFIGFARVIELLKEKNERDYKLTNMINKIDDHLIELKENKDFRVTSQTSKTNISNSNTKDKEHKQVPERVFGEIERFYSSNGVVFQYIKTTSKEDVYCVKTLTGEEFVELKTGYLPVVLSGDKLIGLEK